VEDKLTALVLGANGLIGEIIVDLLLKNDKYNMVFAVSRKGVNKESPKLVQIFADMHNVEEKIKDIRVDVLFSCIGSTQAKSPNKDEYYKIDHDYPILVSTLLKKNGCNAVCLVSSIGANAQSKNFYLRLKGQVEQSIMALGFESTYIFRPSLLMGKRKEHRLLETVTQKLSPLFNMLMIGPWRNFKSISAESVARAMIHTASLRTSGVHIYQTEEIKKLA